MGFWDNVATDLDTFSSEAQQIPEGSVVEVVVASAAWHSFTDDSGTEQRNIKLNYEVVEDGQYNGLPVGHNLKVYNKKESIALRDRQMLAVLANICEVDLGDDEPDDSRLYDFINKCFFVKVGAWEFNGRKGNNAKAVSRIADMDEDVPF